MNLFELVIYQSCNYKCPDCPMAWWTYEPDEKFEDDHPKNAITSKLLFEWVDKYLNPKEWFIRITGGEPSLHPEISLILDTFSRKNFKGIIQTNGSNWLPSVKGWKRVSAWHKDKPFPVAYDYILILENPNDDWRTKEQYCKDKHIPHVVFPYTNFGSDWKSSTVYPPKINKLFMQMTTMFSSGAITGCFNGQADHLNGPSLYKMSPPRLFDFCRTCCNIDAIEYFIWNIPHFLEEINITNDNLRDTSFESTIVYPILTIDNKWVDDNGKVWGILGDDLNKINSQYRLSKTVKKY